MNVKKLLFGAMFALVFTACSNDDPATDVNKPVEEAKTTLRVLMNDITTKADDTESAKITSLQVLVFNSSQNGFVLEKIGERDAENQYQSEEIGLEGGLKNVLVVANYPKFDFTEDAQNGTPYEEVLSSLKAFDEDLEEDEALTMNSKLYEIDILLQTKHYLGFQTDMGDDTRDYDVGKPVTLYRNVARVKLNSVTVSGDKLINSKQYTDLNLVLQHAYILHGKEKTKLIGEDATEWGATYVEDAGYINGYTGYEAEDRPIYMVGGEKAKYASLEGPYKYFDGYNKECPWEFDLETANTVYFKGEEETPKEVEFYVYENPYTLEENAKEIETLLVLKTDFSYMVKNPKYTEDPEATIEELKAQGLSGLSFDYNGKTYYKCTICGLKFVTVVGYHAHLILSPFCGIFGGMEKWDLCENCDMYFLENEHECGDLPEPEPEFIRAHFTRYYTIPVGDVAFDLPKDFKGIGTPRDLAKEGQKYRGVYRNLQYNLNLTLTGEGSFNDKGEKGEQFLQVAVEVAPWGQVTQESEIE